MCTLTVSNRLLPLLLIVGLALSGCEAGEPIYAMFVQNITGPAGAAGTNGTASLGNVTENIIPSVGNTYTVGNATHNWSAGYFQDIYTSNASIHIGGIPLAVAPNGTLTVGGTPIGAQGIQGIQGQNGTQGIQGVQGVAGQNGTQGIQGIAGQNGTNGSNGTSLSYSGNASQFLDGTGNWTVPASEGGAGNVTGNFTVSENVSVGNSIFTQALYIIGQLVEPFTSALKSTYDGYQQVLDDLAGNITANFNSLTQGIADVSGNLTEHINNVVLHLPSMTGNEGKILTNNGTHSLWADNSSGGASFATLTGAVADNTPLQTQLTAMNQTQLNFAGNFTLAWKQSQDNTAGNYTITKQDVANLQGNFTANWKQGVDNSVGNTTINTQAIANVAGNLSTNWTAIQGKQATLVSATNIKTVNGATLLGAGDLVVTGSDAWTYAKLTTNWTTTAASATNVTGLKIAQMATSTYYEFEGQLRVSTATATVNPRVGIGWPTAGGGTGNTIIYEVQSATTQLIATGNQTANVTMAVGGVPTANVEYIVIFKGTYRSNGAVPTNFVQVICATETAGTVVRVLQGSFIKWRTY